MLFVHNGLNTDEMSKESEIIFFSLKFFLSNHILPHHAYINYYIHIAHTK